MRQPYFLSGLLILAMGQQPNDPGTCVVDTAEGSYLGFDLGLHILYCPKIASLEVGGLRLIWFEEAAQGFEYSFWFGILIAEEHIGGNIFQFCIGVDGQMTFAQQGHNGKVAFFHGLGIKFEYAEAGILELVAQGILEKLCIGKFFCFAVIHIDGQMSGNDFQQFDHSFVKILQPNITFILYVNFCIK